MLKRKKTYTLSALIPANSSDFVIAKDIDGSVIFEADEVRGSFECLESGETGITDLGVCPLAIKIVEGGTDYQFNDNFTPADMLLSPGHKKSSRAINNDSAPIQNAPYKLWDFKHTFTKRIELRVSNSSDIDNWIWLVFDGYETKK